MVLKNRELTDFFDENIVYWHDGEVNAFLQNYKLEDVIQCLFNKLKSISEYGRDRDWEWVWKLGMTFGSISKRYAAERELFRSCYTSARCKILRVH